jgi:predicted RNase H-like HicB family nuclease
MARSSRAPSVYRAKGITVQPVSGGGWKNAKAIVYSRVFEIEIETDEEGWLVGRVPELPGCHTQARSEKELIERLDEAIRLALAERGRVSEALFFPPLPK